MSLESINPSGTAAWQKIREHFEEMYNVSMQEMFQEDANRAEKFHIKWEKFLVDYSKNKINEKTLTLLLELANEIGL
ncbi:MAG: glucose-6-phosphate isomerase, partial [Flavobacteriaceae bacterium]|nr:glucose-6-phosphate isomerase [Flavobacteriaceae bacterium]